MRLCHTEKKLSLTEKKNENFFLKYEKFFVGQRENFVAKRATIVAFAFTGNGQNFSQKGKKTRIFSGNMKKCLGCKKREFFAKRAKIFAVVSWSNWNNCS